MTKKFKILFIVEFILLFGLAYILGIASLLTFIVEIFTFKKFILIDFLVCFNASKELLITSFVILV